MLTEKGIETAIAALRRGMVKLPEGGDPEAVVGLWKLTLGDLNDADLLHGVIVHLGGPKGAWWPIPHDLRTAAQQARPALAGPTASELWAKVVRGLHRYDLPAGAGGDRRLHDDPAIHDAMVCGIIAAGGYLAICNMTDTDRPHLQRAFERGASERLASRGAEAVALRLEAKRGPTLPAQPKQLSDINSELLAGGDLAEILTAERQKVQR